MPFLPDILLTIGGVFDEGMTGLGLFLEQLEADFDQETASHAEDVGAEIYIRSISMNDDRVEAICRLAERRSTGWITVSEMVRLYGFPHTTKRHWGCRCGYELGAKRADGTIQTIKRISPGA